MAFALLLLLKQQFLWLFITDYPVLTSDIWVGRFGVYSSQLDWMVGLYHCSPHTNKPRGDCYFRHGMHFHSLPFSSLAIRAPIYQTDCFKQIHSPLMFLLNCSRSGQHNQNSFLLQWIWIFGIIFPMFSQFNSDCFNTICFLSFTNHSVGIWSYIPFISYFYFFILLFHYSGSCEISLNILV